MNGCYAIYEIATGRIVRLVRCRPTMIAKQLRDPAIETYLETPLAADESCVDLFYVDTAMLALQPRPDMPVTVTAGYDEAEHLYTLTFSGVPLPSVITIGSERFNETDDGTFVFETDIAGTIGWRVSHFPYQDLTGETELGTSS